MEKTLKFIIGLLIFILSVHIFATIYYWYWIYPWLDMLMHFLGGFWVAAAFITLNSKFKIKNLEFIAELPNCLITILITISFVALIGVFWEFYEFLYDIFISSRGYSGFLQLSAADTIGDLFFDLLGGLAFFVIYKFFYKWGFKKPRKEAQSII